MRLCKLVLLTLFFTAIPSWSQSIPRTLQGNWRVTAVLTTQSGCWSGEKAANLINTTIAYAGGTLRWKGTGFAIDETLTRSLTPQQFHQENSRSGGDLQLAALGIRAPRVTEYDLQHDDADITDVTTEIPGDTVLLAGPNRIVVSVCGTYFEATRLSATTDQHAAQQHPTATHPTQTTHKSGL